MNHIKNRFFILRSINFGLILIIITILFFSFLDIPIFKFTRTLNGQIFWFFENVIDPISNIFDPFNIAVLTLLFLIAGILLRNSMKEPSKKALILSRFKTSECIINTSLKYYILIFTHIIFSIIFTGIWCHLLKYILGVSRPKYFFLEGFERLDNFNILHKVNALPSGHTQAAFTLSILFMIYVNRFSFVVIIISLLIGLSRIFLSMHFPADIILGAYIGLIGPLLTYVLFFEKKFKAINLEKILKLRVFIKLLYYKLYL